MNWLTRLRRRPRLDQDLDEEIAFHKAMRAGDHDAPAFGSEVRIKECIRDMWTFAWAEQALQDTTYAVRGLRRNPAFAATSILSLAIGLGASVAIFSVADNLMLRPMPYREPDRLMMIWEAPLADKTMQNKISPANFLDWKAQSTSFESMAPFREATSVLNTGDRPQEVEKQLVSAELLPMLGVSPIRGRLFTAEEDKPGGNPVILISHRLWQQRFGGAESVLGSKVELNATMRTVVGVLPPGFYFRNREVDIWEPLNLDAARDWRRTAGRFMLCVGRLKAGVTRDQAQGEMEGIARRLEDQYHGMLNTAWTVNVESLRDSLVREVKTSLWVLLGAVGFLLVVACANVGNLLLARLTARRREMTLRFSLGAGRWRAVRQLLTESAVLGVLGGFLGLLFARGAVMGLVALAPTALTRTAAVAVDTRIIFFGLALSLLTSFMFGLAPAMMGSRLALADRSNIGGGVRFRGALVAAEMALSIVLLVGAGLLFRTLVGLQSVESGLHPANVLTFRVSVPAARYREGPSRTQFFERALGRIGQLPGVTSASAINYLPFNGDAAGTRVDIEGRPDPKPGQDLSAMVRTVMPGYFASIGIPLRRGRDFTTLDNTASAPHRFVVNETFVRRYMPGEEPLEHSIKVWMDDVNPYGQIIGVVGDVKEGTLDKEPAPTVYYNLAHLSYTSMTFVVRTSGGADQAVEPARRVISDLDAAVPIASVRTMEEILGETYARQRFSAALLIAFSAVALLLAAIGIYGVLTFSVTERTREIGVRLALGAEPRRIVGGIIGQGAKLILLGCLGGLVGALALTRFLKSMLYGVSPNDSSTFVVVFALLGGVGLLAAYLPARRASRLDPTVALRNE
jgi:putative ABC transport system permease protein